MKESCALSLPSLIDMHSDCVVNFNDNTEIRKVTPYMCIQIFLYQYSRHEMLTIGMTINW